MDLAPNNDQAMTRESLYGTVAENTFAGITSFSRRRYSRDLRGVDVVVSGVPFDTATSNRPGARFGPRAIRAASVQQAWARHWPWEFDPFDHLAVIDYGDCDFDYGSPQTIPQRIQAHAEQILEGVRHAHPGGDHFISYPLLKAHARKHGPLSLIHFDAHSDTWPDEEGAGVSTTARCFGTPRVKAWWIRRARCRSACVPPMTILRALPYLMRGRCTSGDVRRSSRRFARV